MRSIAAASPRLPWLAALALIAVLFWFPGSAVGQLRPRGETPDTKDVKQLAECAKQARKREDASPSAFFEGDQQLALKCLKSALAVGANASEWAAGKKSTTPEVKKGLEKMGWLFGFGKNLGDGLDVLDKGNEIVKVTLAVQCLRDPDTAAGSWAFAFAMGSLTSSLGNLGSDLSFPASAYMKLLKESNRFFSDMQGKFKLCTRRPDECAAMCRDGDDAWCRDLQPELTAAPCLTLQQEYPALPPKPAKAYAEDDFDRLLQNVYEDFDGDEYAEQFVKWHAKAVEARAGYRDKTNDYWGQKLLYTGSERDELLEAGCQMLRIAECAKNIADLEGPLFKYYAAKIKDATQCEVRDRKYRKVRKATSCPE